MMSREPRIPGLRRALRRPDARVEHDVDDEIAFHIESRVRELVASGQPEEAASRTAVAEFGDLSASRQELAAVDRQRLRRARGVQWMEVIGQELRQAVRSLRRSPAFSVAAVLTLLIGIGANAAIFAVVNGVLLHPLPYGNPDRLVAATHNMPPIGMTHAPQSVPTYIAYQRLAHTITGIGVYQEGEVNLAASGGAGDPQRVTVATISPTLIPVLQVAPLMGHAFTDAEGRPGAAPVIIISERLWRDRFAADPKVLGRTLDVNGLTREIVGVMPERFRFPSPATQLWLALQLDPAKPPPAAFSYIGIARLKPGVSVADAQRDFASVLPRAPDLVPKFVPGISTRQIIDQVRPTPVLTPLQADMTGGVARMLWMVAVAAGLLLLVACANVASLILVRSNAHQRELAVREALGAGRSRVILHFVAESSVLVGIAAVIGLGTAAVAVKALVRAAPPGIPRLAEVGVDGPTAALTLAIAACISIACSLIPALHQRRGSLALREGGRSGTAGHGQQRFRSGLVAAQIALALVVLAGSGLLMRTYQRLNAVRPGFDPEHVATFWVAPPAARYKSDSSVIRFYSRLVDRVVALPEVSVVGLTSRLPLETHGSNQGPLYPEGDPSFENKLPPLQLYAAVNGDYFRAMGIPLVSGRTFDRIGAQQEGDAIISRSTARFFWKDSTGTIALGKRFRALPTGRWYTVIGEVGDTRDSSLAFPPTQTVYMPEALEQGSAFTQTRRTLALVVRTTDDRAPVGAAVQRAVHDLDPTLPTFDIRPMMTVVGAATAQLTFIILILGGAAVVTLLLGAVGLYGVLAYVVTLRTRELGIRIALGATPAAAAAMMARYGVAVTGVGIVAGLAIFALVARFLRTLLFGVAPDDPLTLVASVLLLVAIALAASWIPARRASQVDPAQALRAD